MFLPTHPRRTYTMSTVSNQKHGDDEELVCRI